MRRTDAQHRELVISAESEIAARENERVEERRAVLDLADLGEVAFLLVDMTLMFDAHAPASFGRPVQGAEHAIADGPPDLERRRPPLGSQRGAKFLAARERMRV